MEHATVLIVDDDESVHLHLETVLDEFEQVSAYNRWQALERVEKEQIDLIVLDLNLGPTPGLEVMRELRKRSCTAPFIVMTGFPNAAAAFSAGRLGASEFLDKSYESYRHLPRFLREALSSPDAVAPSAAAEELCAAIARELASGPELEYLALAIDRELGWHQMGPEESVYELLRSRFEQILVRVAVERCAGNQIAAARALGVSLAGVRSRIGRPGSH